MSMRPGEIVRLKRSEWKELKQYGHLEYQERRKENMRDMFYWLGWRASPHDLYQAGWKITMEHHDSYESDMREYRLNISHPATKLVGRARTHISNTQLHMLDPQKIITPFGELFPMEIFFANEIHIVSYEKEIPNYTEVKMDWNKYMELAQSATPMSNSRVITSDLFQPVNPNEIIVPQNNVDDLLEQLLRVQDPKQQEIRERMKKEAMREEYRTKTEEIARIIKVA